MEREFIMIKPDGVQRQLVGEVISRIERMGLKIVALKILQVTREQVERHYAIHQGKEFYEGLIKYITSGPVVVMVVEGWKAVKLSRKLVGATNPVEAAPGSIRGDFALDIQRNIIHAADSAENAEMEYSIYFEEEELVSYTRFDEVLLYG
ncbi:MAG: nucleoside-diphosphate kinase [Candidatus Bathyarchaeota archaeon]|nr:MAG: nucleoside-diphosphate kinase [Candidatus Bathyarchaeota archaeon]